MVDAAARADKAARGEDRSSSPRPTAFEATVEPMSDALDAYRSFAGPLKVAPAQHPDWVAAWHRHVNPDGLVAWLRLAGAPDFAMPLEIAAEGLFRVARPVGGSHANGSFFAAEPEFAASTVRREGFQALFRAIARARPDVDIVALERLAPTLGGAANPLAALPHLESANIALAVSLAGGFETVLDHFNGKRKRKKRRAQLRKFETAGGFRCFRASDPDEVARLLGAFFDMKSARFRKMGIRDVFAPPDIRAFFSALFTEALRDEQPSFFLEALEVGGKLRAINGMTRAPDRIICEFGSIAEDELLNASPGEFLFYTSIEQACAEGVGVFDLSVGDEAYKRSWCDIETRQFDVLAPLTAKGQAGAAILRAGMRAKRLVKNSPTARRLLGLARRASAGPAGDDAD